MKEDLYSNGVTYTKSRSQSAVIPARFPYDIKDYLPPPLPVFSESSTSKPLMPLSEIQISSKINSKHNRKLTFGLEVENIDRSIDSNPMISLTSDIPRYQSPSRISKTVENNGPGLSDLNNITICTCILAGKLYFHEKGCSKVKISAFIQTNDQKRRPGVVESVIKIQRAVRKFLQRSWTDPSVFVSQELSFASDLSLIRDHLLSNTKGFHRYLDLK